MSNVERCAGCGSLLFLSQMTFQDDFDVWLCPHCEETYEPGDYPDEDEYDLHPEAGEDKE